jgi:hypothetical protein
MYAGGYRDNARHDLAEHYPSKKKLKEMSDEPVLHERFPGKYDNEKVRVCVFHVWNVRI